jgi:hypothetical protein
VEDVMAYFDLAKSKFGIKSDTELAKIFNKFVEANPQIHPLALGNVNRIHNLIRMLAKSLLRSHKKRMTDNEIATIVDYFTEKLYSHQYFIGRREAREDLGLKNVINADNDLAESMAELYEEYKKEMGLSASWNAETELGEGRAVSNKFYKLACVENAAESSYFELNLEYRKGQVNIVQQTPQGPVQVPQEQVMWRVIGQGWK